MKQSVYKISESRNKMSNYSFSGNNPREVTSSIVEDVFKVTELPKKINIIVCTKPQANSYMQKDKYRIS